MSLWQQSWPIWLGILIGLALVELMQRVEDRWQR